MELYHLRSQNKVLTSGAFNNAPTSARFAVRLVYSLEPVTGHLPSARIDERTSATAFLRLIYAFANQGFLTTRPISA